MPDRLCGNNNCISLIKHTNCHSIQNGADNETRTRDPRITNALLYQLSHIGLYQIKANAKLQYFI